MRQLQLFTPTPTSRATARAIGQAPAVKAARPRGTGGQPEGKNKPRFSVEVDSKHKLRFCVVDGRTGKQNAWDEGDPKKN
jgi:hypothetical protein